MVSLVHRQMGCLMMIGLRMGRSGEIGCVSDLMVVGNLVVGDLVVGDLVVGNQVVGDLVGLGDLGGVGGGDNG